MAVDNNSSIFNVHKVYILKTASTSSGKCFNRLGQFFFSIDFFHTISAHAYVKYIDIDKIYRYR